MNSDKICSVSIPMAASSSKDLSKKKRVNRSARLKQCKLDARREQWLSRGKNISCKDVTEIETETDSGLRKPIMDIDHTVKDNELSTRKLDIRSIHHYSDSDSPSNSPVSRASSMSGTNFTSSSRGSGSSSSGGSCNGSMIGEDEEEGNDNDGCLDDWEAVADALASSSPVPLPGIEIQNNNSNPRLETVIPVVVQQNNNRAWKADDVFRPHSLPSFSKQLSFPMNSKRHHHHHHNHHNHNHNNNNIASSSSAPSSCPICCEDLDLTDSSFHPCSCGFRLCLFCHKRIVEDDGRCPGCRKEYSYSHGGGIGSLNIQLGRSCSMVSRF
ncbi:uncharacterized protein LOC124936079 [Impatiens glandulifera]|uniref:uncharacterized protein LOC124936079 n=1 Tax=Impatiens glandulifera TaxID=253017 RepID=UPI001FB19AC9|nr:uncharacterized protein LOC124936079 [Impatiens glandulifera]